MPLHMSEAGPRAESKIGHLTPHGGQAGWCLEWCVRDVYQHFGPYRWGGNGREWAINYWDAAKRWGRVVQTSDPNEIPDGAMTFSKGASKYGHVFIMGRRRLVRGRLCESTDFPRSGRIGNPTVNELLKGWGHVLLGYIEITGDGIDLRDKATTVDRMDPAVYGPGKSGEHITWLGQRLILWGFGKHYTEGPGPRWGEADRLGVRDAQLSQGFVGKDADGLPGRRTLRMLAADPV